MSIAGRRQSDLDREVHLNSINNVSSAQFLLQARKQHYRIMKRQPISFLSVLIAAIAVPVTLNAASLSWNPSKIAKDNGIVVLAEETAKPVPKARTNVDGDGVSLIGIRPSCLFYPSTRLSSKVSRQFRPGSGVRSTISFPWPTKSRLARILPDMFRNMEASALIT